jgi:hypothetical protein
MGRTKRPESLSLMRTLKEGVLRVFAGIGRIEALDNGPSVQRLFVGVNLRQIRWRHHKVPTEKGERGGVTGVHVSVVACRSEKVKGQTLCSIPFRKRSNGVGINEWWLDEKDKNLGVIADQIALYIVRHESAAATILRRRDSLGRALSAP